MNNRGLQGLVGRACGHLNTAVHDSIAPREHVPIYIYQRTFGINYLLTYLHIFMANYIGDFLPTLPLNSNLVFFSNLSCSAFKCSSKVVSSEKEYFFDFEITFLASSSSLRYFEDKILRFLK